MDTLKLDIYEPDTVIDYRRPVIIYCHGGGFTAGNKTTDKAKTFGNYFAKFGYLFASIDYRLGLENLADTIDNFQEVYQATQDAKSSVRFFKRYADEYCVDTASIFMIGTSAGGSICLTSAYWQQSEAETIFNTDALGPLENSSGNEGYSSQLKGIISCWGGLPDTAWLRNETEPNQLFHGTADATVPYVAGFNPDSIYIYGSFTIHEASLRNGIESNLHAFEGAGHGVGQTSPAFDTLEQITSDFLFTHLPAGTGNAKCRNGSDDIVSLPVSFVPVTNPSDGNILLTTYNNFNGVLTLFNAAGQLVHTSPLSISAGDNSNINYTNLASGLYFLQLSNGSGIQTFKLVIMHP
ncbi:MAG: alpha/beta hydrolase fold domain-containing protein [Chitinophagales bacterium]